VLVIVYRFSLFALLRYSACTSLKLNCECCNIFLLSYFQVKPLIWIESVIERHAHSRVEYMIKAKSQFKRRSTANNVEIVIPVPADADSPKFKTTIGSVKYAPEQNAITWTVKSFPVSYYY